jgi:hypothetical protein
LGNNQRGADEKRRQREKCFTLSSRTLQMFRAKNRRKSFARLQDCSPAFFRTVTRLSPARLILAVIDGETKAPQAHP